MSCVNSRAPLLGADEDYPVKSVGAPDGRSSYHSTSRESYKSRETRDDPQQMSLGHYLRSDWTEDWVDLVLALTLFIVSVALAYNG